MSFRPSPKIIEAIRAMAREDRRPIAQFLSKMAEDYVAQRKAKAERRRQPATA
jgi:hypothetical protein